MASLFRGHVDKHDEHAAYHSIKEVQSIIQNKSAKQRTKKPNNAVSGNVQVQRKSGKSKLQVPDLDPDELKKERVQVTRQLQYLANRNQEQSAQTFGSFSSQSLADFFILWVRYNSLCMCRC